MSKRPGVTSLLERDQPSCQPTSNKVATVFSDSVATPGPDSVEFWRKPEWMRDSRYHHRIELRGAVQTAHQSWVAGDIRQGVSGGGGRVGTDSTVPVTRDGPVESEPTCKALPVPTVGTNGIAGQSGASSHDSGNASGQEVPAEPVAGSSGGQLPPRPPACHVGQDLPTAERGQSAAAKRVQRAAAGVPRACPDLSTIVVEEAAAQDEPGMAWQTGGGNIPADLTRLRWPRTCSSRVAEAVRGRKSYSNFVAEAREG